MRDMNTHLRWLGLVLMLCSAGVSTAGTIRTVAGNGENCVTGDRMPPLTTMLCFPAGVWVDAAGNIYIADNRNNRIAKVRPKAAAITTFAGSVNGSSGLTGDGGPAAKAAVDSPKGVCVDKDGNVYIADSSNHRVRKVAAKTGVMSTVAGMTGNGYNGDGIAATAAKLYYPSGVCVDAAGNLYIADKGNYRVRKVDAATGLISTVAGGHAGYNGDGIAAAKANLNMPQGVAVDAAGNVYIADTKNARIRRVDAGTGLISTVAGSGTEGFSGDGAAATAAQLSSPAGVFVDAAGSLYVADSGNHRVRKVDAGTGVISTVAGTGVAGYNADGIDAATAQLNSPAGVFVDASGNVYIADNSNHRIRKIENAPAAAPARKAK